VPEEDCNVLPVYVNVILFVYLDDYWKVINGFRWTFFK